MEGGQKQWHPVVLVGLRAGSCASISCHSRSDVYGGAALASLGI